jgi:two-component system, cell cycle response regulator
MFQRALQVLRVPLSLPWLGRSWQPLAVGAGVAVLGGVLLVTAPLRWVGAVEALLVGCAALSGAVVAGQAGLAFTLGIAGLELALGAWGKSVDRVHALVLAAALLLAFSVAWAGTRVRIAEAQRAARDVVEGELDRIRETARSYRLGGFAEPTEVAVERSQETAQLLTSSVEHLHTSLEFVLRLVSGSLGLRTIALLWVEEDDPAQMAVREVVSDVHELSAGPFDVHNGIIAAALSSRQAVVIEGSKARGRMPIYAAEVEPTAVYAIPLIENDKISGVLLADALPGSAHRPAMPRQLSEAGQFVLGSIHAERLLLQTEHQKTQQRKLYQAAESLAKARTETEVIRAGVESARRFTSFDFAAVTLYHEEPDLHEICAVSGDDADELVGSTFKSNGGLVSMVVESRHSLPYRGEFSSRQQLVFTPELAAPAMQSLLILPLFVHDTVLGTLILGSRLPGTLGEEVRPTLEVLSRHVAVSLANARMVKRLGELATTDGMTGHLNKRALIEVAQQKICSAARFSKPLSVIIGDIDFFKRVNDTHGHDVGDIVIRGFGAVLRRTKRETDAVGRFGGEEFVMVCEETDATGARLLAERVRQELSATVFHTKQGPLQVTCSLGVATMPSAGGDWDQLFKASDEALYGAKRGGRNRVVVWAPGMRSVA